MSKVSRSYRMPVELVERLESLADALGQSRTVFVERAVRHALDAYAQPTRAADPLLAATASPLAQVRPVGPPVKAPEAAPKERAPNATDWAWERQQKMNKGRGL